MRLGWLIFALVLCSGPALADAGSACVGTQSGQGQKTVLRPGWVVCVYPRALKGQTPFPVGRFIAPPGGFAFGDFRKTMPHPGWASFRGGALFNVKQPGAYTFSIILKSSEHTHFFYHTACETSLRVAETELLTPEQTRFRVESMGTFERSFTGGLELPAGGHPIEFGVSCPIDNGHINDEPDGVYQSYPELRDIFDKTRVTFTVFGPDDMGAHLPRDNQLVHDVQNPVTMQR